jgi:glycine cleavage system aminomethyltransferase T
VTTEVGVLTIAGPSSAELLERVSGTRISESSHPFFSVRDLSIGPVLSRALRLSYTGELGWELHLPIEMLRTAYLSLVAAGNGLGLTDVGYRALDALGMEKGYGAVGADLEREHTPLEAGLGHLVRMSKGPFRGRDALLEQERTGIPSRRVCLLLDTADEALPYGMEPVLSGGKVVGFTARGGYGHRIGRGLAFAYLPPAVVSEPSDLSIRILGRDVPVSLTTEAAYDPEDRRRTIGSGLNVRT